jgi:hypothetical protein
MPGTGQKTVDVAEDGADDDGGVVGIEDFFGRESVEVEDANQYYSDEEPGEGQGEEGEEGQIEQLPEKEDEPAEDLDDFFD